MNTQTTVSQMQHPQLPAQRQPLQLQKQLLAAQRRARIAKERLKDLEAKEQALFRKYGIATKDEILEWCSEYGAEELFVSLCKHPLPRKMVKEKLRFCQELRDIATAAGIDASPLIQSMDNHAQLLRTAIAAAKAINDQ